jgi:AcrR family transcriptional regulator
VVGDGRSTRERILDAAAALYAEVGPSRTRHRDIAERAGLSRPPVYKHVGDQEAIAAALLERELDRFHEELRAVLDRTEGVRDRFVDGLVFAVRHARGHPVLQRVIADDPNLVLPLLTTRAAPLLKGTIGVVAPYLAAAMERGEIRHVDPEVVAEWLTRLVLSIVLTPGVTARLDDPDELRRFVDELFTIGLAADG